MKAIEGAANEWSVRKDNETEAYEAFKAGVAFAEQMIPVSEELPSHGNGYIEEDVIIEDEDGNTAIGSYSMDLYWSSKDELIATDFIVSWRPLKRR